MIEAAKGLGGPQAPEVSRMLSVARERLDNDLTWCKQKRDDMGQAEVRLQSAFEHVATGQ